MLTKVQLIIAGVIALILLIGAGVLSYKYWDRGNELAAANTTIATRDATIANLNAATQLQNSHVEEYENISERLTKASKQGLAEGQKTVKQQDRRIAEIRTAPKADTNEEIRQKMIKDALL